MSIHLQGHDRRGVPEQRSHGARVDVVVSEVGGELMAEVVHTPAGQAHIVTVLDEPL